MGEEPLPTYVVLPVIADSEFEMLMVRRADINGISTEMNSDDEVEFYVHVGNDKHEVSVEYANSRNYNSPMEALMALTGWGDVDDECGRLQNLIENVGH